MTGPHLTPEREAEIRAWARAPIGTPRSIGAALDLLAALDVERAAHAQTRTALTDSTALLTSLLVSSSHLPWRDLEAQIVANQVALGLAVAEADKP